MLSLNLLSVFIVLLNPSKEDFKPHIKYETVQIANKVGLSPAFPEKDLWLCLNSKLNIYGWVCGHWNVPRNNQRFFLGRLGMFWELE